MTNTLSSSIVAVFTRESEFFSPVILAVFLAVFTRKINRIAKD